MHVPTRTLAWAGFLALVCSPALAAVAPRVSTDDPSVHLPGRSIVRTGSPGAQRALDASPAWQGFRARNGAWRAVWNENTGTPHRAFGRGVPLPGFARDASSVDGAVRAFVAGHPELFRGVTSLEPAHVGQAGRIWYVRYRQTHRGVPVLFSDWEFRLSENGRLVAFGADAHEIPEDTPAQAVIPGAVARQVARSGMSLDAAGDRVEGGTDLYLLPLRREAGFEYRLVYDVRVHTAEPPGNWITLVDATDGRVLWRHNRVRFSIDGTATGLVHPTLPTDPTAFVPFANMYVSDGTNTGTTGATGTYSLPSAGAVTITAALHGPFCNVNRSDAPDAAFSQAASNPATVDIQWDGTNAHEAERDGFYHTNVAHDYVKALDPGLVTLDYEMPCVVNINSTCNAFWNGTGINFYLAGGGCVNTATMPDVVYHEYGHGVNDKLYEQQDEPFGMLNGSLHEGMADVLAAFMMDDPVIGKGFFGPGTSIRTVDNTNTYPNDVSGDGHITGLILGGAWWDLREAVGLSIAENLAHFSKYGLPDDPDAGVAMNEFFLEALLADDDDADLSNGTPNSGVIIEAFNAHGIGTGFFIDIAHTALGDQPGSGPYPVTATVQYDDLFGISGFDPDSVMLHYAVNGGPFQTVAMPGTGSPDEFSAAIPTQEAALVRYYVEAKDQDGGRNFNPPLAPTVTHLFLAGPATSVMFDALETNPGWTIGTPQDSATTGIWEWGTPIGTSVGSQPVAPGADHSDPGTQCYFTGNASFGSPVGTNDVDGGQTTLTTTSFDATAGGPVKPLIEYYRWYTNDQGSSPGSDDWVVEISNDGGTTWVDVENTRDSVLDWARVIFFVEDFVMPTNDMKLRFTAEDVGGGSIVEAAVDDLSVIDFTSLLAVDPVPRPRLSMSRPAPNPFVSTARLRFALPRAGPVDMHVYDLQGRVVRTLARGSYAAGEHAVEWNGLDDTGAGASSGLYFVRLSHPDGQVVRNIAYIR